MKTPPLLGTRYWSASDSQAYGRNFSPHPQECAEETFWQVEGRDDQQDFDFNNPSASFLSDTFLRSVTVHPARCELRPRRTCVGLLPNIWKVKVQHQLEEETNITAFSFSLSLSLDLQVHFFEGDESRWVTPLESTIKNKDLWKH